MATVEGTNIILLSESEIIAMQTAGGRRLGYLEIKLDSPNVGQATLVFPTEADVAAICGHINTVVNAGPKDILPLPLHP